MVRVLHIGKYYPPFHGGIESFVRDLAEYQLQKGGIEPSVLVHQHKAGQSETTELVKGVFVKRVHILVRAVFTPIAPLFLRSLNKTIKERNPDILHLHLPNPSTFWCLFSTKARDLPWVIHWHADVLGGSANIMVKVFYPIYRIFEKALLRRAKVIICTSPPYLETSVPLQNFKHKSVIIPLGLTNSPPMATRRSPFIRNARTGHTLPIRLIAIGRLTYYKGHTILLEALKELPNAKLDIVGTGTLQKHITQSVRENGLADRVTIHGNLSDTDLTDLLATKDLLCLTSVERTEAFGLVILEAARLGIPALVTDVPGSGMSWVVDDEHTGIVVPAANAKKLTKAIRDIERHRMWLKLAGVEAKRKFEREFSIQIVAGQIETLYVTDAAGNFVD